MRTQSEMTFTCLEDANPTLINVFALLLNSCRRQRMHAILLHGMHAGMARRTRDKLRDLLPIIVEKGLV